MELPAPVVRIRGGRESHQGSLGQALEVLGRFRRKLQRGASFPDRVERAGDVGPGQWRLEDTALVFSGVSLCGRCHGPGARDPSRGCLLWDQRAGPLRQLERRRRPGPCTRCAGDGRAAPSRSPPRIPASHGRAQPMGRRGGDRGLSAVRGRHVRRRHASHADRCSRTRRVSRGMDR